MKDSNQVPNKDWRESRPHLLLLSKFVAGDLPARYANTDYWEPVLKESPEKAIQDFLKEGMLERAELRELLDLKYKATELKSLLKERGLKVSGRKTELIERLISWDKDGMLDATKDVDLCRCTAAGKELAEGYINEEKVKKLLQKGTSLIFWRWAIFWQPSVLWQHTKQHRYSLVALGLIGKIIQATGMSKL